MDSATAAVVSVVGALSCSARSASQSWRELEPPELLDEADDRARADLREVALERLLPADPLLPPEEPPADRRDRERGAEPARGRGPLPEREPGHSRSPGMAGNSGEPSWSTRTMVSPAIS